MAGSVRTMSDSSGKKTPALSFTKTPQNNMGFTDRQLVRKLGMEAKKGSWQEVNRM